MARKWLLVLLEIGMGLQFQFIGSISASEIFLLLYFITVLVRDKQFLTRGEMKKVTRLYVLLLCAQALSELVVGNSPANSMKGLAVTVVSYCHLVFLMRMFLRDRSLVAWIFVGMILRPIVFPTFEGNATEAMTGEDATFLKFVFAPMLTNILLLLAVWKKTIKLTYAMMFLGLVFVVAGARSSGGIIFCTGAVAWFIMSGRRISRRKIISAAVVFAVIGYGLYVVYVNEVLAGRITAGNSEQLLRISNPYNPIALLMTGRTEMFVGWVAFMDAPLFGHGAWARDPGMKYHALAAMIGDKEFIASSTGADVIPTHSVLISAGALNGILAFICMALILYFFLRRGIRLLTSGDRYLIVIICFIFHLCWHSLLSPHSHFRHSLPLYFAFIFVSYILWQRRERKKQQEQEKAKTEALQAEHHGHEPAKR